MKKYGFRNFPGLEANTIVDLYDRLFEIMKADSESDGNPGERLVDRFAKSGMDLYRLDNEEMSNEEWMNYLSVVMDFGRKFVEMTKPA